ncbi:hypothetical protein ACFUEN_44990 [Streptomyces griseorubiginosus]|uniref:hypothetical protein n=1 Tax=Streptomyces griseorubiginosus TaxID=67304 RepID=UPI0036325EC9
MMEPREQPGLIVTLEERQRAVAEWLLVASPDPRGALQDWINTGITVLACDAVLSAVRMPTALVQAAVGTDNPDEVAGYLAASLCGGPVIASTDGLTYYALVPPSTRKRRLPRDTECLDRSALLVAPRPDLTDPSDHGRASYWAVPMDGPGDLCQPDAVIQLATVGSYRRAQRGLTQ